MITIYFEMSAFFPAKLAVASHRQLKKVAGFIQFFFAGEQ